MTETFLESAPLSLGVEEELMIVDARTLCPRRRSETSSPPPTARRSPEG